MTSPRATSRPRLEGLEARDVPAFVNPVSTASQYNLAADLNGDGRADLVAYDNANDRVSVRLGNGDGTFRAPLVSATGDRPYAVKAGDFTGDGKLDLVTINWDDLSLLRGRGDGTFLAPVSVPKPKAGNATQAVTGVAVGDLNKDGKDDLVLAGYVAKSTRGIITEATTYVTVYKARTNGSFQAGSAQQVHSVRGGSRYGISPYAPSAHAGDFDADGDLDVLLASGPTYPYYTSHLLLGNGTGTLGAARLAGVGGGTVAVGDLDGDGDADVVRANYYSGTISVFLSTGSGFTAAGDVAVSSHLASVALADLNRDGRLDVVAADLHGSPDSVHVLLGAGGALQAPQAVAGLPGEFLTLALADFDGDGWIDLAFTDVTAEPYRTTVLFNDRRW